MAAWTEGSRLSICVICLKLNVLKTTLNVAEMAAALRLQSHLLKHAFLISEMF